MAPPVNSATYVRAYLALSRPQFVCTLAQMQADGFDQTIDTLYAVVFQLSSTVGRGFPGYATLPANP